MNTRSIQALASITRKEPDRKVLRVMVSTRQIDRHRSIILPSAFEKHIKTYMSNPVILWSHDPNSPPVGKALSYKITSEGLELEIQFAVAENPEAARLWALYEGGYLKGFSVGGLIHDLVYPGDKRATGLPDYAQDALRNKKADYIITVMELLEVSACAVPSNPGAIRLAVQRGVIPAAFGAKLEQVPGFTAEQFEVMSIIITEVVRLVTKELNEQWARSFATLVKQRGWK